MASTQRYLVLGIFLTLVGGVLSQAAADAVSCTFSVYSNPVALEGVYYWGQPRTPAALEFRSNQRSAPYRYQGPRQMDLFRPTGASDPRQAQWERIAIAELPAAAARVLLVVLPNDGPGLPYRVVVIEESAGVFPPRSVVVLNQSGYDLRGLGAGTDLVLAKGAGQLVRGSGTLAVQLALEHRGKYIPAFDQRLVLDPRERIVLLLLPPSRRSSPLVRWAMLSDELDPPPDPAAAAGGPR